MHRTTISQTEPKFPGSGAGYKYRGSFVYSVDSSGNERLESVACDEGRISVTYNSSGTPLNRWRQSGKEEQVIGGNDLGVLDFGARHYDPWPARWTTQDPMAGKYTNLSPYSYCAGNPINLVDLSGKDIWIWYDEGGEQKCFLFYGQTDNIPNNSYVRSLVNAYLYNKMNWKEAGHMELNPSTELVENHKYKVSVFQKSDYTSQYYQDNGGFPIIIWNPNEGIETDTGAILSPATVFTHEADHAVDDLTDANAHFERKSVYSYDIKGANKEEARVIKGSERLAAIANGEIKNGQVTRRNYSATTVITNGPTSTKVIKYVTKYK